MTREQLYARERDIPQPIWEFCQNNALLYHVAQRYVHGDILTLQECLCQMVVHLAKDWTVQQQRLFEQVNSLLNVKMYVK